MNVDLDGGQSRSWVQKMGPKPHMKPSIQAQIPTRRGTWELSDLFTSLMKMWTAGTAVVWGEMAHHGQWGG